MSFAMKMTIQDSRERDSIEVETGMKTRWHRLKGPYQERVRTRVDSHFKFA